MVPDDRLCYAIENRLVNVAFRDVVRELVPTRRERK